MKQAGHTEDKYVQGVSSALDRLDAAITPEGQLDTAVAFMQTSHAQGKTIQVDFDEQEFTRAYPDWRNK
jgi:hypothetical protein